MMSTEKALEMLEEMGADRPEMVWEHLREQAHTYGRALYCTRVIRDIESPDGETKPIMFQIGRN